MEHLCKNCKWWGEEKAVIKGCFLDNFRLCKKSVGVGFKMYSFCDSECDEDINAWEEKEQEQ